MKTVRPMFTRLVVFSVPERAKLLNGLYKGNSNRHAFSRAEEIWVVAKGKDVREDFKRGDHAWLNDSFELEPSDLDLWDEYKDLPEFAELKAFVEQVEGRVRTQIVIEDSILVLDNDYEIETQTRGIF